MTEAELGKKWENAVWDTDVYLDDLDGKEPLTNEDLQFKYGRKGRVVKQ